MPQAGASRGESFAALAAATITLIVVALLSTSVALAAKRTPKVDPEDLKELRGRIERLRGDIASAEETRNEARDGLRESEHAISEANRALRNLGSERQDLVQRFVASHNDWIRQLSQGRASGA